MILKDLVEKSGVERIVGSVIYNVKRILKSFMLAVFST